MSEPNRIRIPQWIQGVSPSGPFVVRVTVDAVILNDDDPEPCFEPAVLRQLDEWQRLADAGKLDELAKVGEVYVRRSA